MASNSGVQQQFMQQQGSGSTPHRCKECGLTLNSAESLEVHVQYHKENLMKHWVVQAQQSTHGGEETNNNTTSPGTTNTGKPNIKRELIPNNTIVAADSSDSMQKKSPDYSRATPDQVFGHPPTPQSFQSASSPYQSQENSSFSPNFASYQQIKKERNSPTPQFQHNYPGYPEQQYFPGMEQQYNQEVFVHKSMQQQHSSYRYHPYSGGYERQPTPSQPPQQQVSSSSPAYPPQPTPSPSPKQCDKCGYVCESASQLIEHLNIAHPPTPAPHLTSYQPNQHFMFDHAPQVKQEDATTPQSDILDLDSHKVVHNQYTEEEEKRDDPSNPHPVPGMLNSWTQQQKIFQEQQQRMFVNPQGEQKLFQPHQMHSQEFMSNGVTTTTEQPPQPYRPFEHMPSANNTSVISSSQVPTNPTAQQTPGLVQKSSNWKSNEARRPKTYNCTACNKWFTSSGHLKRHYNTTLHKNAVKSSGQPDPAGLPISAHHHPARDNNKLEDRPPSGSSGDEIRGGDESNSMSQFDRLNPMAGMLQPHHTPPLHSPMPHSPMAHSPMSNPNMSGGSPPNGDAGLSTNNLDSRGLLSLNSPPIPNQPGHGYNMAPHQHMMPMENSQFQMYPNEFAPHVTQAMAISSLSTTGEPVYQFVDENNQQPLPSFAQIQAHRYSLVGYEIANVGGGGMATAPITFYQEQQDHNERAEMGGDDYKLTVLTNSEPIAHHDEYILGYSPSDGKDNLSLMSLSSENDSKHMEESKMQIMEDIKLRLEAQPKSPEKAHTKRDYEDNTSSPLITSTVLNKPGLHKCYDCDKVFNKACYLTQHNKTFHSGDKPFKCTRCGKRFSCDVTYQEHLSKHAGDKPHKCDLCPKQFNHKTDLRRHMCLHTGQKPYACDTCGKGFIRKDHMMKHCETHLRKTQSKIAAIR
nr:unnamed protein product [Callosobruchus chinensis]